MTNSSTLYIVTEVILSMEGDKKRRKVCIKNKEVSEILLLRLDKSPDMMS